MKTQVLIGNRKSWKPCQKVLHCMAYQEPDGRNRIKCEVNGRKAHFVKEFHTLSEAHEIAVIYNLVRIGEATREKADRQNRS